METGDGGKLWGTNEPQSGGPIDRSAAAIGGTLLAILEPDLFGRVADRDTEERLAATRRRRARAKRLATAREILAEPWTLAECGAPRDAVTLARRFLRRHPEKDRADPAPPFLTGRQEAALWHAEEEMVETRGAPDFW